jgi:hypothetical protein
MVIKPSSYLHNCKLDVVVRSAITEKINHGTLNFSYMDIIKVKEIIQHTLFIKIDMKAFDPHLYITLSEFRNIVDDLDPKFSQKILNQLEIDRIWIRQGKTI